jgi:hypothetical protein
MVAVVDQAVWDLSSISIPDPYETFYRPRNLYVTTSSDLTKSMDRINANIDLGSKGGSGGGCFSGNTPILMADGRYKPISKIASGDYILTRKSENNPEFTTTKIQKTFVHDLKSYILINDNLKTTHTHRIYTKENGWITVDSLKKGNYLLNTDNNWIRVKSIRKIDKPLRVYNLHTEDYHTFFAGNIWVHNQKGMGPITARDNFLDTAYWKADIETNAQGQAHVELALPDNTTTWRIITQAVNKDTAVCSKVKKIKTSKKILVQPLLPRFLSLGDRSQIGMLVHNQTDEEQNLKTSLKSKGLKISNKEDMSITIPARDNKKIFWDTEVTKQNSIKLEFKAENQNGLYDIVNLDLPVNTYYTKQTTATAGKVDDYASETLKIPDNIVPDQGEFSLTLSPSMGADIQKTSEYLLSYPYQCNEQISSQVFSYSNLLMLAKDKKLNKIGNIPIKKIQKETQSKVYTLTSKQKKEGGWGWWSSYDSDPIISSLVLQSLYESEKAGMDLPEESLAKAESYLKSQLNQNSISLNQKAFVSIVLSEKHSSLVGNSTLNYLMNHRWDMNKAGRAYLLKGLINLNKKSDRNQLNDELLSSAILTNTTAHWEETQDKSYNFWRNNDSLTAIMMQNMLQINTRNPLIEKSARWLIDTQKDNHWKNTHTTAQAIKAFTLMSTVKNKGRINLKWKLTLDKKEIDNGKFADKLFQTYTKSLKINDLPKNQKIPLEISKTGNGPLYYNLNYHYYLPFEQVDSVEQGMIIVRDLIDENGNKVTNFEKGNDYWIRLTYVTAQEQHHVVIEDKIPAGFEIINNSLATTATSTNKNEPARSKDARSLYFRSKEIRDDRLALFAQKIWPGVYEHTYKVRALHSGKFHHPPARAYNMYLPDIFGHSQGGWLEISN